MFRWTDPDKGPVAKLEISRPGGDRGGAGDRRNRGADGAGAREIEAAGVTGRKFGNVTLLRSIARDTAQSCVLPGVSQAGRRSQPPDVRLVRLGQQLAGTALRESFRRIG